MTVKSNIVNTDSITVTKNLSTEGDITTSGTLNVTDNLTAVNITNSGTATVGGTLTAGGNINNSQDLTVEGHVVSKDIKNSGTLIFNQGAETQDITNDGSMKITGELNSRDILNKQGGIFNVIGNVVSSNITNKGDMDVNGDAAVTKNVSNSSALDVTGSLSAVDITNTGVANIGKDLTSTGVLNNTNELTVDAHALLNDVTNSGTITIKNGAETNDITTEGALSITGNLASNNITNTGDMDVDGDVTVTKNVSNSSTLDVTGSMSAVDITNTGVANIGKDLTSTGVLNNTNELTVDGHASLNDVTNSGTITIKDGADARDITNDGNVYITGDLNARDIVNNEEKIFDVDGNVNASNVTNHGDMDINGNLAVENLLKNTGDLDVIGTATAKEIQNTGNFRVFNNASVSVNGDLTATENITTSGLLEVAGSMSGVDVTNDGVLSVVKDFTSTGELVNTKQMTVDGHSTLNNASNSGTITLNNGVDVHNFTNTKTANIYHGFNADSVSNDGTISLTYGTDRVGEIVNNSQLNITESTFTLDNKISGNGNVNIKDSTFNTNGLIQNQAVKADNSTLNFGNNGNVLKNSTLNVSNNTIVNTKDGVYTDYEMDELHSSADSRYSIDVMLSKEEQKADTFNLKNGGSGIIHISSINVGSNIINDCDDNEKYVLQIIKTATENDAPQLDYDGSKVLNQAAAEMTSDIIFAKEFGLASTSTVNDSIEIRGWQDTFGEWADYETPVYSDATEPEKKVFTFVDDSTTTLTRDASEIAMDDITIKGANNTFNVNDKDLLSTVREGQKITISNINLVNNNNEKATDNKGILNLDNVRTDKDLINNNDLNMTGVIELANTVNNSELSFEGSKITMKDFTNTANALITGDVLADNITNEKTVNITGDVVTNKIITNKIDGEFNVDGSVLAQEIKNDGNVTVEKDVTVNEINNTGKIVIHGDTSAQKITNTEGAAGIIGNVVAENIYNDRTMDITGDISTNKITNLGTIDVKDSEFVAGSIETDSRGVINLTNTNMTPIGLVQNQDITSNDSTINVFNPYNLSNNSMVLNETTLNLGNFTTAPLHFTKFDLNDGSTVNITSSAVDFTTNTMGKITSDDFAQAGEDTVVHLYNINVLNNIANNVQMVEIPFADMSFAENVKYHGQKTVYTPVYKFGTSYDFRDGDMVFVRGGYYNPETGQIEYPSNPSDMFNPAALTGAVASQIAAAAQMNQTMNYAFQHSDNFMLMPKSQRLAEINRNKYAIAGVTDTGRDFALQEEGSAWYKPFVGFESMELKIGPKVSSTTYGSMLGYDTPLKELKHGWARAFTTYGGYNGSQSRYSEVDITQNGASIGGTMTLYKGNFFNATTLNLGANFSENSTMFGKEDTFMLVGGVANKTGYNLEFKDGRFILQPNVIVAYSCVKTFDYTNAAGVRTEIDPLHAIQVAPGAKFIMNTKRGWQPYLAANVVMNFMDKSRVTVDNVALPEMSIKPYVQYGIGIQKVFKDNFMAFGSAMLQNGGRSGVGLNFGLRWEIGGDKNIDSVMSPQNREPIVLMPDIEDDITQETPKVKKTGDNVIEISTSRRPQNNLDLKYAQKDVVDLDVPESVVQPIVYKAN